MRRNLHRMLVDSVLHSHTPSEKIQMTLIVICCLSTLKLFVMMSVLDHKMQIVYMASSFTMSLFDPYFGI